MKTDTYTKIVITIIALLLVALAVRPSAQSVHAAAATKYVYSWLRSAGYSDSEMENNMDKLKAMSAAGCDVIAALPIAGTRNDNVASGTMNILYICRKPQ
jgi:hypothetical protein